MGGEVIFEKRYPKVVNDTLMAVAETMVETMVKDLTGDPERREARLGRALADRVLVPLPQRRKSAEAFIQTAREVSELYELDVKVVKYFDHITVTYYFNAGGGLRYLRDVIRYADELSFFANSMGYEIVLSIDHYTHAVFRGGRRIYP